jgi:hypothetical protein
MKATMTIQRRPTMVKIPKILLELREEFRELDAVQLQMINKVP